MRPPVPDFTAFFGSSITLRKLRGIPVVRFILGCLSNSLSPLVGH